MKVEKLLEPNDVCIDITGPWLKWRYRERPFRRYECAFVGEPESPKALIVYHVLESSKRVLIMEFLVAQDVPLRTVQVLIDHVVEKCKAASCSSVCCLAATNSRKADLLRKNGFWRFLLGSAWRPSLVAKSSRSLSYRFFFFPPWISLLVP